MVFENFSESWTEHLSNDGSYDSHCAGDDHSDSVGVCLQQMGRTLLLTRQRELDYAEEMERRRAGDYRNMLRQELGREPTRRELTEACGLCDKRLRILEHSTRATISLDLPDCSEDERTGIIRQMVSESDAPIHSAEYSDLRRPMANVMADGFCWATNVSSSLISSGVGGTGSSRTN